MLDCPYWFTALDCERIERARRAHGPPDKAVTRRGIVIFATGYSSDADALAAVLAILEVVADVLTRYRDHPQLPSASRSLRDQLIVGLDGFRPKDLWPTLEAFATAVEQALAEQPWWSFGAGAARTPPFPDRATWLAAVQKEHGFRWSKLDEMFRGPTQKTLRKIRQGETVDEESLSRLIDALGKAGIPVSRKDIPNT